MAVDFNKLGLDRLSQNIARAVNSPTGRIVTGDITRGEVVSVEHPGGATSVTTKVKPRRTGALLLNIASSAPLAMGEPNWNIEGTILTVSSNAGSAKATFTFWVF